jgi:predicted negative regulator of RcsB-dependent stress response
MLEWTKNYTHSIFYGVLGIIVIVGMVVGWSIWQKQRWQKAEALLYEAVKRLDSAEKTQAMAQFQHITHDYGTTPASALAHWYLGHLHFEQGDYAAALASYEQARRRLPDTNLLMPALITLDIGYVQEAKGICEEAITSFEALLRSSADWIRGEAFLGIGRCYEKQGMPAKALATYERALSDATINSAVRQKIEERQALLHPVQTPPTASDQAVTPPGKP